MTQRSRPRILAFLLAIALVSPVPLAAQLITNGPW